MSKHPNSPRFAQLLACLVLLSATQCNHSNCERLRDQLSELKSQWQACQTDTDCVMVGGNAKDCTGILSCNFAVNRREKDNAEREVASLPEETVDCIECASPNCISGESPFCEPTTGRCSTNVAVTSASASPAGASMAAAVSQDSTSE